jgi:hypothetical protein
MVLLIGSLVASLVLLAIVLPEDGTDEVLLVRGRFGAAEILAARGDVQHLALRNDRGELVSSAWIRRPRSLRSDYRIVLTYAGANTGARILDLIPERDDLVLVAVQYPWQPPRTLFERLRAPYDIRQAAYRTVAGGLLAMDYLQRQGLDTKRTLLLGASLGSVFATMHGALDERVPEVVLIHGGATLPSMLHAAAGPRTPEWLKPVLVRLAVIPIDTFDPAHYVGRISPRRLVIIAGREDRNFPPQAVVAFFALARNPKELRWTDSVHVGVRNRRVVAMVLAELEKYLAQR